MCASFSLCMYVRIGECVCWCCVSSAHYKREKSMNESIDVALRVDKYPIQVQFYLCMHVCVIIELPWKNLTPKGISGKH